MRPNKPYKAVDPIITINNIRNILTECDIFLIEKHHTRTLNFSSSRLTIGSKELYKLDKGTNGKGLTPAYSLASAYGEFMERIQNYSIFVDGLKYAKKEYMSVENEFSNTILNNNLVLDFSYDPDEKYILYDELSQKQKDIFNNIAIFNESANLAVRTNDNKKLLFAPFYCVKERCSEFLPINLLLSQSGSNGMCAGNTKEEAILQGICEIFERFVSKTIYKDEITPPTIPTYLFKETKIYDLLTQLEKDNDISIIIKDCSLNQGLPVIGLLIIDHNSNSCAFKLGADTSPVTALERCFTELFQGRQLKQVLKKIDITKDSFEHSSLPKTKCKYVEFIKFFLNGEGRFPNSILSSNFSYPFDGINQNLNKSDKEDLKYLLVKIKQLGFNIYLRDVSFLNFPSFYVYIPGMSEIFSPFKSDNQKSEFAKNVNHNYSLLLNLKNNSIEEYIKIARILEEDSNQIIRLTPYNVNENNSINKHYLLALIYYRISNYSKSYEHLTILIDSFNDEEKKQNIPLICSRDCIYFKAKGLHNDEIFISLQNIYKKELLLDVMNDLENETDIFQYQSFPTCFNCKDCEIKTDCLYFDVVRLIKNIQEKHKKNRINQDTLRWISELS